jgi:hypothetical protein
MAKQGAGAISNVTVRVKWFDGNQALLQTDLVPLSALTPSWQRATANVTAPAGAATVYLDVYSSSGGAGDSLYLDDIVVTDVPN